MPKPPKTPEQVARAIRLRTISKQNSCSYSRDHVTIEEQEKMFKESSIEQEQEPQATYRGSYYDSFTMRRVPTNDAFWENLAVEMLKWFRENEEAYKLTSFLHARGIPPTSFESARKNYPVLKAASDIVMSILGDRRETKALQKKLDAGIFLRSQHHYDSDWDAINKYHAELKKKELDAQQSKILVVKMPSFEGPDKLVVKEEDEP